MIDTLSFICHKFLDRIYVEHLGSIVRQHLNIRDWEMKSNHPVAQQKYFSPMQLSTGLVVTSELVYPVNLKAAFVIFGKRTMIMRPKL
jgi:hypothetical protein